MFCSKCGANIDRGVNFCHNCGVRINRPQHSVPDVSVYPPPLEINPTVMPAITMPPPEPETPPVSPDYTPYAVKSINDGVSPEEASLFPENQPVAENQPESVSYRVDALSATENVTKSSPVNASETFADKADDNDESGFSFEKPAAENKFPSSEGFEQFERKTVFPSDDNSDFIDEFKRITESNDSAETKTESNIEEETFDFKADNENDDNESTFKFDDGVNVDLSNSLPVNEKAYFGKPALIFCLIIIGLLSGACGVLSALYFGLV